MKLVLVYSSWFQFDLAWRVKNAINGGGDSAIIYYRMSQALESFSPILHSLVVIILPQNTKPSHLSIVQSFMDKTQGDAKRRSTKPIPVLVCLPNGVYAPCVQHRTSTTDPGAIALRVWGFLDQLEKPFSRFMH